MNSCGYNSVRWINLTEEEKEQRLDNYLFRHFKGVPHSHIYRIIRSGEVRVNGGRVKNNYRLKGGDQLRIPPLRLPVEKDKKKISEKQARRLEQAIIYEDKGLLVINKPSGLAVHGGSGISLGVIEQLRQARQEEKSLELVHRLDRDTSGLLLISKRRSALRELHQLLQGNQIRKTYLALLHGSWGASQIRVELPLRKIKKGGERIVIVDEQQGKRALTIFRVKQEFTNAMLVEIQLKTGRTHQIRVHAQSQHTPICGDEKYGIKEINQEYRGLGLKRLFLHASELEFPWNQQRLKLSAPLDEELGGLLKKLK